MDESLSNFVNSFHNLEGETVKTKQRNLFKLFLQYPSLQNDEATVKKIIVNLEIKTHLEHIFYIDFLIYYRQFDELYENFTKGDEITVKKLSKHDWFYKKAFETVGSKEFVFQILPSLSQSLKMKVLNRLPVSEKNADEIFELLQDQYGVFIATNLLSKCSKEKIRQILGTYPIQLNFQQLLLICEKDADLIPLYLHKRVKNVGNTEFLNNNHFLIYLAQTNPEIFFKLLKKYKFKVRLGRRTSKQYISNQKDNITMKPEAYIDILHNDRFVRKLGNQLKSILLKTAPDSTAEFWKILLKFYPKRQQFKIYKSLYDSTHFLKFGANFEIISEKELELVDDIQERERIAKQKFDKNDDKKLLRYFRPAVCIEYFLQRINFMSVRERTEFIEIALDCCLLNKDFEKLLQVSELVANRFKNDESFIREAFFRSLAKDIKLLDHLQESHWKPILEILAICDNNREWIYNVQWIQTKYLQFLDKNNQDTRFCLKNWNNCIELVQNNDQLKKTPKFYKALVCQLVEIGSPKPMERGEFYSELYDCRLLNVVKNYNKFFPKDKIRIFDNPRLIQSVKTILTDYKSTYFCYDQCEGIQYIVCQNGKSDLKKLFFQRLINCGGMVPLEWFVKHDPKTLQDNFEYFLKEGMHRHEMRRANEQFWLNIKKLAYLNLDKLTIEFCETNIRNEDYGFKQFLVAPLAILQPVDSYLKFITPFIPTAAKVDLQDNKSKEMYTIQGLLIGAIHFTKCPKKCLPIIMQFCKGDFLKYALPSLYKCLTHIPEIDTKIYIEELKNNVAFSVKKHGYSLTYLLNDKKSSIEAIETSSINLLIPALKYFAKNPTDLLWHILEKKIADVSKQDVSILKPAVSVNMPFDYKSKYFQSLWTAAGLDQEKLIKKLLADNINKKTIKMLDTEFVVNILKESFLDTNEMNKFLCTLLINLDHEKMLSILKDLFDSFKQKFWNGPDSKSKARKNLNDLITTLYNEYMSVKEINLQFVRGFIDVYELNFSATESFEEFVLIHLMKAKKESVETVSKIIFELNGVFQQKYSNFVITVFASILKNYVFGMKQFTSLTKQIQICHCLYKMQNSINDCLLVLALLPVTQPKANEDCTQLNAILNEMTQIDDEVIQLQLNLYLKSIEI